MYTFELCVVKVCRRFICSVGYLRRTRHLFCGSVICVAASFVYMYRVYTKLFSL